MKSKQKRTIVVLLAIGLLIGISVHISLSQFGNFPINMETDYESLDSYESSETNYEIGMDSFNSTGSKLNISLLEWRNETKSNSTENGGISIKNPNNGNWNMSKFSLNFTDISAKNKSVKFETRNDGSLQFKKKISIMQVPFAFQIIAILQIYRCLSSILGQKERGGIRQDHPM